VGPRGTVRGLELDHRASPYDGGDEFLAPPRS
jgi:hypothetical protein